MALVAQAKGGTLVIVARRGLGAAVSDDGVHCGVHLYPTVTSPNGKVMCLTAEQLKLFATNLAIQKASAKPGSSVFKIPDPYVPDNVMNSVQLTTITDPATGATMAATQRTAAMQIPAATVAAATAAAAAATATPASAYPPPYTGSPGGSGGSAPVSDDGSAPSDAVTPATADGIDQITGTAPTSFTLTPEAKKVLLIGGGAVVLALMFK